MSFALIHRANRDLEGGKCTRTYPVLLLRRDGIILYEPGDDVGLIVVDGFVYQGRAATVLRDR